MTTLAIGLVRGRAGGAQLFFFPVLALPVTALALIFVAMIRSSLANALPHALGAHPTAFEMSALGALMLFGYLGGLAVIADLGELYRLLTAAPRHRGHSRRSVAG